MIVCNYIIIIVSISVVNITIITAASTMATNILTNITTNIIIIMMIVSLLITLLLFFFNHQKKKI